MKKSKGLIFVCMATLLLSSCGLFSGGNNSSSSNNGESETSLGYAIYGDFSDSNWVNDPEKSSKYYIDPTNVLYSVEVTFLDIEDAKFRVVEYGTNNLALGYNELDLSSTGVLGTDSASNILVNRGETYELTIKLGSSKSILVTQKSGLIDDEEPGSSYDGAYQLYGSFNGDVWTEGVPNDTNYVLPYNSLDSSSKYWKRTVTMASKEDYEWTPAFRITEYGTYTTIAGYSELAVTSNSSITASAGDDDNLTLDDTYAGVKLDLTIDLRDSYTINIDTHDESFTECDGYQGAGEQEQDDTSSNEPPSDLDLSAKYYLVGDYDNGWEINTAVTLSYDPRYSNSLYWQRTITMSSGDGKDYYPGFRVVDSSWGGIVTKGNATIDSASTAYDASLATDSDYNFKVPNWGSSYDITIDMRGSEITVLIDYHVDGFDGTINGRYDGSAKGDDEYAALNIDDNYIMGMDISSIAEVEAAGGKFYDYDGNSVDLINYLASQGINYARLRLWNDPTDSSGNSYLGGSNDLETDLKIAKRCVDAGMKICLDLQYSDFWAHHGQQYAPKTWFSMDATTKISNASSWTTSVLQSFANAGCTPSMVQVGNETNNNEICGLTSNSTEALSFFTTCCNAIRSFDSSIQIVIHYSDDQNVNVYESYLNSLINANCSFDVIGLSYYPFWHENGNTSTSFKNTLSTLDNYYTSKKVCIMEYSYAFTTTWQNGNNTMNNSFYTDEETYAGLSASVSNQKKVIYDINSVAASVNGCLGSFYWEPAWLAVSGSAWASSASASYYQANNVNTSGYSFDTCSWSNQALFDYSGVALDSLKIYNTMWGK